MTNPIPRKSAAHIAARIVVTLGVFLLVTLMWEQVSEPNALPSGASEPAQYGYLAYSGDDVWHRFPAVH